MGLVQELRPHGLERGGSRRAARLVERGGSPRRLRRRDGPRKDRGRDRGWRQGYALGDDLGAVLDVLRPGDDPPPVRTSVGRSTSGPAARLREIARDRRTESTCVQRPGHPNITATRQDARADDADITRRNLRRALPACHDDGVANLRGGSNRWRRRAKRRAHRDDQPILPRRPALVIGAPGARIAPMRPRRGRPDNVGHPHRRGRTRRRLDPGARPGGNVHP
jgi:hypothetical protein